MRRYLFIHCSHPDFRARIWSVQMSELYALDVPDVDAAYAAARYSGGRVMLPFALGATSQAFMDTMGLVAACDAASRGVPARMVTMNFFGGNATPKGAMTELSAALGMSIMPTTSLTDLTAFWCAVYAVLAKKKVTVPASAVKGSNQFLAWVKILGTPSAKSVTGLVETHLASNLTAIMADLKNSDDSPFTFDNMWGQLYISFSESLGMSKDFLIEHNYAKNHPKQYLAELFYEACRRQQRDWTKEVPTLAIPDGHAAGTKIVCDVSQDGKDQPDFWRASLHLMRNVLLPHLKSSGSAAGSSSSNSNMPGSVDSYAAMAAAQASAAPLSDTKLAKIEAGTISDPKAFQALIHHEATANWVSTILTQFNTEAQYLVAFQCHEDTQKFMVGSQLEVVDTTAGKMFAAARSLLKTKVVHMGTELTGDRLRETQKDWVTGVLRLADAPFKAPLDRIFMGVHANGTLLTGDHFWGLLIDSRRKFDALILMDPAHVTATDSEVYPSNPRAFRCVCSPGLILRLHVIVLRYVMLGPLD